MQTITNISDELYGNMVEALNKFYWDNSIAPIVTAARLDEFASEVSRLAQFIRTGKDGLESAAELLRAPDQHEQSEGLDVCPNCHHILNWDYCRKCGESLVRPRSKRSVGG